MKRSPMPTRTVPLRRTSLGRSSVPLTRSVPLRRVTGLVVSVTVEPKRRRDTGPTAAGRRTIDQRSGKQCELVLPGCWGAATEKSHRLGRKSGGRHGYMRALTNGPAWVLDACRRCHEAITSATEPALTAYRDAGLLLVEGQDARLVPVLTRHALRPVLLGDDGCWAEVAR